MRHGTPIQFTGSTGIYQYHNENFPVLEIKCDLFPIHCFLRAERNEIESLKTEKSPGIILEKSWNFVFMFLYEPCYQRKCLSFKSYHLNQNFKHLVTHTQPRNPETYNCISSVVIAIQIYIKHLTKYMKGDTNEHVSQALSH